MRILIISRYPPFPGGRENFVFELANQLSKNNKVLIITPDQENFDNNKLVVRKYPESKELLERMIIDFKPDVINSHTFYLSKDAAEISNVIGIPFGITLHGDQFAIGDKQRQQIISEITRMSDFVINVSEDGKKSIIKNVEKISKDKLYVINNGVNLEAFNPFLKEDNFVYRKELNISAEKKIILTPTRVASYKGLDFLLDSIAENKLFLEENNILFLISIPKYDFSTQEKNLFNNLKQKIQKNNIISLIKFIFLSYEEVKKAYSISDIFLLPSEKEQLPVSILEAMACSIPIIATKVGGIPELLENNIDAYLVDFGNNAELVVSIKRCLIDRNSADCTKNAYEKVLESHSIEKIAWLYQNLYMKYISQ